jgi:exonuclease SbcC
MEAAKLNSKLEGMSHQVDLNSESQSPVDPKVIQDTLDFLRGKKEEAQNELLDIKTKLEIHASSLKAEEQLRNKFSDDQSDEMVIDQLNSLIGDEEGDKFANLAAHLALKNVIDRANAYLSKINHRFMMKPGNIEDESEHIQIVDHLLSDSTRSVKTLSGGEIFQLSLSLALALSDHVSKGEELGFLFIDEGFGSLDPETLEQTLYTLEFIQKETRKTIGIISHIDYIKERIPRRIDIERSGDGFSQISIRTA